MVLGSLRAGGEGFRWAAQLPVPRRADPKLSQGVVAVVDTNVFQNNMKAFLKQLGHLFSDHSCKFKMSTHSDFESFLNVVLIRTYFIKCGFAYVQ